MLKLSKDYNERVKEEEGKTAEQLLVGNVGKIDPKRHLDSDVATLMASNIVQCLGAMLDTIVFWKSIKNRNCKERSGQRQATGVTTVIHFWRGVKTKPKRKSKKHRRGWLFSHRSWEVNYLWWVILSLIPPINFLPALSPTPWSLASRTAISRGLPIILTESFHICKLDIAYSWSTKKIDRKMSDMWCVTTE